MSSASKSKPAKSVPCCPAVAISLPPQLPPEPCCCDSDPIAGLKQLFVDYFQGRGMSAGRDPATRPVFLRLHGVAHGRLIVQPNLPRALQVGVFASAGEYETWVRFSSDVQPGSPDLKGTCGIGIKLFGVPGKKLLESDAATQDFILQNHDVFFVDDARAMCEFTCASLHQKFDDYVEKHPVTGEVLKDMEKVVESVLTTPYWSVLPYAWGQGHAVKYKLEPEEAPAAAQAPDFADPFYLREDLHSRLRRGPARFRFMVQLQKKGMPLDAATVRWSESESKPVHVATLELHEQDLDARGQSTYGENLAFNPWHSLEVHRPLGSISEARKVVYAASAANRKNVNGIPQGEPSVPRPAEYAPGVDYPQARDTRIVRAAVHPAIGVARVGNSVSEFYTGPLVPDPEPQPTGSYRDAQGALKREAAQFRVYGFNAAGEVVRELTSGFADVTWKVHVANRKAAWYQWQIAMDIPEAAKTVLPLRNKDVKDRASLIIDAGSQTISGPGANPVRCVGKFTGVNVQIGELQTDPSGRLLFLAGHGVSASPKATPIFNPADGNSFINADGWYDDTCDGTVEAEVTIEGRSIPVESAWVVTAPPNYAPQVKGVRTMYDLLNDLYIQAGWLPAPGQPSFTNDVLPILQRLSGLQWVNQGFAVQFGHLGPWNFGDPALVERLGTLPPEGQFDPNAELRRQVFNSFRLPNPADGNQLPWPWLYGDAMEVPAVNSPRQNAAITATQHQVLSQWAAGKFTADWIATASTGPKPGLDDLPVAAQPAAMDRAALEFCLADAFHPGCEMTWPMRHLTLYSKPFRIRRRPPGQPEPDYGDTAGQQTLLAPGGPLYDQGPGDINRWMGLPWQADTAWCRAGYDTDYDPFAPTFWPARVPNHVLSEKDYLTVINSHAPMEERITAFANRTNWNQPLTGNTAGQMLEMIRIFGSMGLVEQRAGVTEEPAFPSTMMVASYGPAVPDEVVPASTPAAQPGAENTRMAPAKMLKAAKSIRARTQSSAHFANAEDGKRAPLPVRHTR